MVGRTTPVDGLKENALSAYVGRSWLMRALLVLVGRGCVQRAVFSSFFFGERFFLEWIGFKSGAGA